MLKFDVLQQLIDCVHSEVTLTELLRVEFDVLQQLIDCLHSEVTLTELLRVEV